MPKFIPCPIGVRFGRLVVTGEPNPRERPRRVFCACDCGERKKIGLDDLRRGRTKSCGCWRSEWTIQKNRIHGKSRLPEYVVWKCIRDRCLNETDTDYLRYGGRGISICERWSDFANFYADMGPRSSPSHSIDRIDNNGPYSPENCRWATWTEQQRNRRNNHLLTFQGRKQCLAAWSDETGILSSTISERLRSGWGVEQALTTPTRHHRQYRQTG